MHHLVQSEPRGLVETPDIRLIVPLKKKLDLRLTVQ